MAAEKGIIHPFSFFSGTENSKLFLYRIDTQSADLKLAKFEYEVLEADRVIGKIYFSEDCAGQKWFWEITDFAFRGKHLQKGSAGTLHDAKRAIAHALDRSRQWPMVHTKDRVDGGDGSAL
jgi:hypothetical protein